MGTGQGPAAQLGVPAEQPRGHAGDIGRPLHVAQLPAVEVAPGGSGRPAEEDVARGLHAALARDHPVPFVIVSVVREVALQDGRHGFLDLQEERVVGIAPEEQHDEAAGPHASDADDLAGRVGEPEAIQQEAAFLGEGAAVLGEDLVDLP